MAKENTPQLHIPSELTTISLQNSVKSLEKSQKRIQELEARHGDISTGKYVAQCYSRANDILNAWNNIGYLTQIGQRRRIEDSLNKLAELAERHLELLTGNEVALDELLSSTSQTSTINWKGELRAWISSATRAIKNGNEASFDSSGITITLTPEESQRALTQEGERILSERGLISFNPAAGQWTISNDALNVEPLASYEMLQALNRQGTVKHPEIFSSMKQNLENTLNNQNYTPHHNVIE